MTTKAEILKAVRAKGLDCSCYQPAEVAKCPVTTCDLWPYRFGRDPTPNSNRGFAKGPVHTHDSTGGDRLADDNSEALDDSKDDDIAVVNNTLLAFGTDKRLSTAATGTTAEASQC
jgi:hypothetical protein